MDSKSSHYIERCWSCRFPIETKSLSRDVDDTLELGVRRFQVVSNTIRESVSSFRDEQKIRNRFQGIVDLVRQHGCHSSN